MRDLWYETYLDLDQLTDTGVSTTSLGDLALPHLTSSHVTFPTLPVTSSSPSPPVQALAPLKYSPASPDVPIDFGYNSGVDVTQESPLAPEDTTSVPHPSFTPPHSHAHNMLVLQPQWGDAAEC
ncbi:hypothetical protein OTU49_006336 [Cherax quadricarinatus]|uniref:Uncharacterized protein n=1 Tax=Cherax quadricarinatus TaxID=27406 RepID=A0AAW0WMV8_CHEQU